MAVHIPLSVEAQVEARVLMLSSNNILSPANGSPIIVPSQDIVLGIYYMTRGVAGCKGEGKIFANADEVRCAYDAKEVDLHAQIVVRMNGQRFDSTVGRILLWEVIPKGNIMMMRHIMVYDEAEAQTVLDKIRKGAGFTDMVKKYSQGFDRENEGMVGLLRIDEFKRIFNATDEDTDAVFALEEGQVSPVIFADDAYHIFEVLQKRLEIPFSMVNNVRDKKTLRQLVDYSYRNLGPKATVILSDRLKDIGYRYSTEGGLSISIDAMIIPAAKGDIIEKAENQVEEISRQYTEGLITQGEKYNKVVDIWAKATDDVADEMMEAMREAPVTDKDGNPVLDEEGKPVIQESLNPIYMFSMPSWYFWTT
jgi:DNA-directed RNA polymerase subunit beta'